MGNPVGPKAYARALRVFSGGRLDHGRIAGVAASATIEVLSSFRLGEAW
jgi:hypothetical protein